MKIRDFVEFMLDAAIAFTAGVLCTVAVMVPHVAAGVATHNAQGGYIDACGDLPGLVGDDC